MVSIKDILSNISNDVQAITESLPILLGKANPPLSSGVYMLSVGTNVVYVGEAKGTKGLRDRLLSKHVSGDDSHAIQRAYVTEFPDRVLRRAHILANVLAQWLQIDDRDRISAVERVLIYLHQPIWNKK